MWESVPESFGSVFQLSDPLFERSPVSEGFVFERDAQPFQGPAVPGSSVHIERGLVVAVPEDLFQEYHGVYAGPSCGKIESQYLLAVKVYRSPKIVPSVAYLYLGLVYGNGSPFFALQIPDVKANHVVPLPDGLVRHTVQTGHRHPDLPVRQTQMIKKDRQYLQSYILAPPPKT